MLLCHKQHAEEKRRNYDCECHVTIMLAVVYCAMKLTGVITKNSSNIVPTEIEVTVICNCQAYQM